jgi:putative ABC transport system permease protein
MLALYARLKPGMTAQQAQVAVQSIAPRVNIAADLRDPHPEGSVQPVAGAGRLRDDQMKVIGLFFLALLILAGFVLLIACANVASLLLARASVRRREIAIRLSLGASRGRLLQQLLTESLLLSVTGAIGGILLAHLLNLMLGRVQLPTPVPIHLMAELDWRVALYAAALTVVATAACGLLPAWQSVRESFVSDFHTSGRMFLRRAIVVGQIGVSIVVLAPGFLFVRNLLKSSALSPGFDILNTVHAKVNLQPGTRNIKRYADQVIEELKALPGVRSAAAANIVPFTDANTIGFDLDFGAGAVIPKIRSYTNSVTPEYFNALSIPILEGRTFEPADATRAELPVIVNRTFVDRYRHGRSAIGDTFRWKIGGHDTLARIIGVVGNTRNMTIGEGDQTQIYQYLTAPGTEINFLINSSAPPNSQLKPVTQVLRRIDPNAGIETQPVLASIGFAFLPSQIGAALFGAMGVLGLVLALIGLYGVMSYSVARRTREIGVRMAIGAPAASIFQMVLKEAARLTAIGSIIGLAVAWIATRPLAAFLVDGLDVHDPITFAAVLVVFALTAFIASWSPARRATTIDPISCLRHD